MRHDHPASRGPARFAIPAFATVVLVAALAAVTDDVRSRAQFRVAAPVAAPAAEAPFVYFPSQYELRATEPETPVEQF